MAFLDKMDRRVLYWVLMIAVAIPYIRPLGLPLEASELTVHAYESMQEIQPGDVVLLPIHDPGLLEECGPTYELGIDWLMERGVKIVFVAIFAPELAPMIEYHIKKGKLEERYTYGVDFVNLGFIPGWETAVAGLATSFQDIAKYDTYGNAITDLELTKNLQTAEDFAATIGYVGIDQVKHWYSQYNIPVIPWTYASAAAEMVPYYEAGQYAGIIGGKTGGAEFEYLLGRPGANIRAIDSLTVAEVMVVILIIIGNITLLTQKMGGDN
jgi:hypothetical protein